MRCQQAPWPVQDRGFVSSPACWEGGLLVAPGSRADDGYPPSGVKPEVSSAPTSAPPTPVRAQRLDAAVPTRDRRGSPAKRAGVDALDSSRTERVRLGQLHIGGLWSL